MEEGFPKFCEAFDDMGYDRDTKAFLLKKKNEFPYEWLDSYDKLLWSACGDHATEEPCGLCKESSESAQCRNTSSSTSSVTGDGTQLADVSESFCNHIKGTLTNSTLSSSMVLPASLTMPCSTISGVMAMSTLSC